MQASALEHANKLLDRGDLFLAGENIQLCRIFRFFTSIKRQNKAEVFSIFSSYSPKKRGILRIFRVHKKGGFMEFLEPIKKEQTERKRPIYSIS